jgi:hypothetical protein
MGNFKLNPIQWHIKNFMKIDHLLRLLFSEHERWAGKHEQMNSRESFQDYFVDKYFATCSWMNDIYG